MLTRHLAKELATNTSRLMPSPRTVRLAEDAFVLNDPKARAGIARDVPLGQIGMPDDMAGVAIYVAFAASFYVTGAVVPAGGGLSTVAKYPMPISDGAEPLSV